MVGRQITLYAVALRKNKFLHFIQVKHLCKCVRVVPLSNVHVKRDYNRIINICNENFDFDKAGENSCMHGCIRIKLVTVGYMKSVATQ